MVIPNSCGFHMNGAQDEHKITKIQSKKVNIYKILYNQFSDWHLDNYVDKYFRQTDIVPQRKGK